MVKKKISFLFALVLLLSCCSCSSNTGKVNEPTESSNEELRVKEDEENDILEEYRDNFVSINRWEIGYVSKYSGEKDLGITKLEIENSGDRDLDMVEIEVVFRNDDYERIFTYDVAPINSISDGTFYSGNIWSLEKDKYYIIENAPSQINLDYCTVKVKDIIFSDDNF